MTVSRRLLPQLGEMAMATERNDWLVAFHYALVDGLNSRNTQSGSQKSEEGGEQGIHRRASVSDAVLLGVSWRHSTTPSHRDGLQSVLPFHSSWSVPRTRHPTPGTCLHPHRAARRDRDPGRAHGDPAAQSGTGQGGGQEGGVPVEPAAAPGGVAGVRGGSWRLHRQRLGIALERCSSQGQALADWDTHDAAHAGKPVSGRCLMRTGNLARYISDVKVYRCPARYRQPVRDP